MKKQVIAAVLATSAFVSVANAADGTINFTGNITDAACTITPGTSNQNVAMGTVSSTSLANIGDTSAPSRFSIEFSACPASATNASVKFDGPTDASNSDVLGVTQAADAATGVAVALFEIDATTLIPVGSVSASKPVTAAGATLEFVAKYMATGVVAPGSANAVTDFTIDYN